ncbi:MAG: hypothetical protein GX657_12835 [Chloroflexi bacterium]|jgi:hypothetical protein|nr:hypothetical protein [Chloroflexota bacterium]
MATAHEPPVPSVKSPEEAWEKILLPLIEDAKRRGRERYGDEWAYRHTGEDTCEYRAWHGLQVHANARLAQVPELIERGQFQLAYTLLASTAYHFAVIVAQVEQLRKA